MFRKKQQKTRNEQDADSNKHVDKNDDYSEEKTVFIKEFDMNEMPPHSPEDNNGVKIVAIGKPGCFAPGTKVLMFDGSMKKVEDIVIGDKVMGDDGETPRTVEKLYHDIDDMFEICPKRGTNYTVNSRHPLVLKSKGHRYSKKGDIIEIPVNDYIKTTNCFKNNYHCFRSSGINCWIDNNIKIDPYFLGVWLGDGTSSCLHITNIEHEILEYCEQYIKSLGLIWEHKKKYKYIISSHEKTKNKNCLLNLFNELGLLNNKHIPHNYKVSSRETRFKILAGLIDTDGYMDKKGKGYDIIQKNETLMDDIIFIARSLGFSANKKQCKKSCMYKGEKREGVYYRCLIQGEKINEIPVLVKRKKISEPITKIKDSLTSSFKIIPKGIGDFYGFELDGNKRFLLSSFEVTHNTGKSSVIASIVASKAHIIPVSQIFSGTEDSNHFYTTKFPSITIFNSLKDLKPVENFICRQKYAKRYLDNPWNCMIIDDCTDDPKLFTRPLFQSYYKNGRHWKMMHILSLQYCLDIKPVIRTNIDYTFICRESNKKNRKALFENYASCVDSQNDFETLMDALTTDYSTMVIVNRLQSNEIEDCIRWYKADLDAIKNFRFGCDDFWMFNDQRLDSKYEDPVF